LNRFQRKAQSEKRKEGSAERKTKSAKIKVKERKVKNEKRRIEKTSLRSALCTLRLKNLFALCALLFALCALSGCANNRFQHAADKSLLIQENLQLDQALSITQYELMLAQQENDALRRQLDQVKQSANGNTSGGLSNGRMPPLRSQYEPVAPAFDAIDPNLPPPSNQVPHYFQRPQQNQPPDQSQQRFPSPQSPNRPANSSPVIQASRVQYVEVPPGAPQWSPQRQ